VRHTRGRVVEVDHLDDFVRRLEAGARDLAGWRCRDLDLRGLAGELATCHVAGSMFLGCRLDPGVEPLLESRGAVVFPTLPDVPLDTYRATLYSAAELYGEGAYRESLDARAYGWAESGLGHDGLLAATLHDHAVDRALASWVAGRSLVGVMGGHAVRRGSPAYAEAARLGRLLGRRHVVATGGGPGAMEAANLGARLCTSPDEALEEVLTTVAEVPHYDPDVGGWAGAGFRALDVAGPEAATSETLGIPTWHYGHEPPNVFASAIAKYVRNAVREAVLLEVCDAGIVFLPGAAGTVQEVFQDACENYYADPSSVASMVLVGRDHWTRELPVWPLLEALARDREMADRVHLVDDVDEAAALVG
jgi:predicted Rossmann-fold nucleotide-binding protein